MDKPHLYQVEDGWIETRNGHRFHFRDPKPEDIDLDEISVVLPRLCRYNGHTKRWYSVAEHTCLMCDWVMDQPWATPRDGLTALHHDDAEYIIGDLARPVKATVPQFKARETVLDQAIALRFDTIWPFPNWLKDADSRILKDERRAVMYPSTNEWGTDALEELGVRFMPISGRIRFLTRWQWLRRHHRLNALHIRKTAARLA